jgi:hypothetical protein
MIVRDTLSTLGIAHDALELGSVELLQPITEAQREAIDAALRQYGLELLDDKRGILIEKIKAVVIEVIHYTDELPPHNYSDHIAEKLGYDYNYLSNLFSEVKGVTIQHFIIYHKIEKVKELLMYDELTLTQISYKMHYSSVAHLSNQFKKVTGLTPTFFKSIGVKKKNQNEEE